MNAKFNKPKGFSEILDHTFSLSKNRFKDFFMILLILMGPVYLLQAIIQLLSGVNFFRELGSGGTWYEQILSGLETESSVNSIGSGFGLILVGFISFLLFPVAEGAILFAINHIRKNEEYTVGSVIKKAFSRFWPMIGSSILFGLITFGLVIVPIFFVSITGFIGSIVHPAIGILLAIILFLACAIGIGYLLTRWSFYFGSVVLDWESPGFSNSWRLTKNRTWILMGLYLLFFLIISSISFAVEMTFSIFLGYSVLLSIISNLVTLFTTMILSVGYGVMYLDLKIRHDADDLKEMIDDYHKY
ncbi:hypothetical protein RRV45_10940 [Bacillus sp. DTU_2020_1000418_1_SI_GHA_SEK_038]|uniref:hypothetical protein n=1 Tax=Bacillus sp. DTU_2020_1000418_1_SI_GHA_SEK_038 TaxID=3077585 RepID=UPI0028E24602|nr:hypothetical protein [Bacillus sp. DTU_2020_1000418_1_SI_GHA_SEK_038]WNS77470.1 hypothetical protein RRV45_10940 [Bacillus sp. DTU_2020_1000418_1_SI_GHA_SEK_038]